MSGREVKKSDTFETALIKAFSQFKHPGGTYLFKRWGGCILI